MAVNVAMAPAVAEGGSARWLPRALSALVLAPIALGAALLGSPYFAVLVGLGCAVLAWEWRRLLSGGRFGKVGWLLLAGTEAVVAAAAAGHLGAAAALALVAAGAVYIAVLRKSVASAAWHALGVIYLAVPCMALLWLRQEAGSAAVLWLFLVVWATDITAFAAGRGLGGPRLAPRLSPRKTWAGLLGGLLAASAVGALLAPALGLSSRFLLASLSALVSLVAQGGDLAESAVKRHFGVKDMSGLIPGHGGLFDRVDGLLAAAPAVALIDLLSPGSAFSWR